ncbi:MAG: hypothetical protein IJ494_04415 [Bacteroides sp.]|nr:hypothetical protein [Bacteroides sp.]
MKHAFILNLLLIWGSLSPIYANTIDSLLHALDEALEHRAMYEEQKLKQIASIKEELKQPKISDEKRFQIHQRLFTEYKAYNCDSALHYTDQNLQIATRQRNRQWINRTLLNKADILGATGLYVEALELLKSLPRNTLEQNELITYYEIFESIYLFQAEYNTERNYIKKYLDSRNLFRDSLLSIIPKENYKYANSMASLYVDRHQHNQAISLLKQYLAQMEPDTRHYAILTSTLAFIYHLKGDKSSEKEARIRSALADVKAMVKENYSLTALAELLYTEGQLERAYRYIQISMEDANSYSTRLRSLQVSKILPLIYNAYQLEKAEQQQKQNMLTLGISLLSLLLLLLILYVFRQMSKLARARREVMQANRSLQNLNKELQRLNEDLTHTNERQQHTNLSLRESNHIKEEYLGRFLDQCSSYINKLEEYRRMLNKQAASGQLEELFRTLKSNSFVNSELKEFYHNFDMSFLKIFPHFVEAFNSLLPAEEQLHPKGNELLTTELRIFALIRLGITDSGRIANFLRYSITTIYTYRSKLKNKSLYKDDFEEQVMQITSY